MCGIAGFYAGNAPSDRKRLHTIGKEMGDAIAHRGPDSHDVWQDPDTALVLSHRRLAIIDLTEEGHQPMHSSSERYVIIYNGEIYNYLDLQKDLEAAGTQFRGRSDTEVILAAIEHWGLNQTLQKINGMFVFALWDRKERELHLVRDRLGKKPLYVGWAGKNLVFGSELKALHTHPDFSPDIDRGVLASFMRTGYVQAPHCIYQNVWSLPAGHRLTVSTENLQAGANLKSQMQPFWNHLRVLEESRAKQNVKSDEEIINEFEDLLSSCVKDRLISDVPLGAFLSGGIDSSAIVALMQKNTGRKVKTYTIGFEEKGFDESAYAKKIADHLGTDHHEQILTAQDALDIIPQIPEIYDEPFADISVSPTYLVSRFSRKQVTVALSGDGGDEMLGGYSRHFEGPKIWNRMKMMPRPIRKMLAGIIDGISTNTWDRLVRGHPQFGTKMHKVASVLSLGTQEDVFQRLVSQWEHPPVIQAAEPVTLLNDPTWQPQNLSFSEKMMYWDALSYLPNDILTKVDRASMAVSLEARAPLLDKRIYEYVWSLPEHFKIRNGQGKWLLRQVLARHVPVELFERPKQGFNIPVGEWIRGPLRGWAEDLLDEQLLRRQGYLNPAPVRAAWDAHLNGQGNHAAKLWAVLMFQAWQDRWL